MTRNNLGTTGIAAINEAINHLAHDPVAAAAAIDRLRSEEPLAEILAASGLAFGGSFFTTLGTIENDDPAGKCALRTLRDATADFLVRPWNTFEIAGYEGIGYRCDVSDEGLFAMFVVPRGTSCPAPDSLPPLPGPLNTGTTGTRTLNGYALEDKETVGAFLKSWYDGGADIEKLREEFSGNGLDTEFWDNAGLFPKGLLKKLCKDLLEVWDAGVEISLVKVESGKHELKPKVYRERLEFPGSGDAWIFPVHVPKDKACND